MALTDGRGRSATHAMSIDNARSLWDVQPGSLDGVSGLPDLAVGVPLPVCAGLLVDGRAVLDPAGLFPGSPDRP